MARIRATSASGGGGGGNYTCKIQATNNFAKTHTISGYKGKKLLIFLCTFTGGASLNYNALDGYQCTSGGTLTRLGNITTTNYMIAGTFFQLDVTSDTCIIEDTSAYNACLDGYVME